MDNYDRWKTTQDEDDPVLEDFEGIEIYEDEEYYDVDDTIVSKDTLENLRQYIVDEDDNYECSYCEETNPTDAYYVINGQKYCDDCIEEFKRTCTRDEDFDRWDM